MNAAIVRNAASMSVKCVGMLLKMFHVKHNEERKNAMERKKISKPCGCGECNTPPPRPTCLELVDAKRDIYALVNKIAAKIPFYLLEGILSEVAKQAAECAKVERENAQRTYQDQLAKFEKKGKEEGNE